MALKFQEYKTRKIINIHKHVDGPWYWGKYTAHPYVGCRSGCDFCYLRGARYLRRRDPETFDSLIQVKTNAIELMRKEFPRLEKEIISVGDWQQPAEDRYRLSRAMLEQVLKHRFPLFIIERSPLLTRDIDLLREINRIAWVGVLFSISNLDPNLKMAFEPRSPGFQRRLEAMQSLAEAGIYSGVSMMPVIPFVGDSDRHLEDMVIATRDHGGRCLLSGGLTMDGDQALWTLNAFRRFDPDLVTRLRKFYNWQEGGKPNMSPPITYNARIGLKVRELCAKHGILDRMPRYIAPGPLEANKRIAERLFLKTYDLELERARSYLIWAYRRAAWTVDEHPHSVLNIYLEKGEAGLQELPSVGKTIAAQIARWLEGEFR
ncbi:MAG: radical SAM protein [Anaerolineales bacterium]|jgi:DNA repair photolyase